MQLEQIGDLEKLCHKHNWDNQAILQYFVDILRNTNPKEVRSQEIDGRFCKIIGQQGKQPSKM